MEQMANVPCAFQGVHKTSIGYRLISGMGWKEGEGLGLKKDGIRQHVRIKKCCDRRGVGNKKRELMDKEWEQNCRVFDKVLSQLTEFKAEKEQSPIKKREVQNRKKKRKKVKSVRSHVKRYAKQKKAKLVQSYSETDLAAILGQSSQDLTPLLQDELSASVSGQPALLDDTSHWWADIFVRAGTLDEHQNRGFAKSLHNEEKITEHDQERMYSQAQEISSKSRQGLGKRKQLKVAGLPTNRGKRIVFDSTESQNASTKLAE